MGVDVAIVAGGYATRLRPLTYTRPKAALPILGKRLIEWVVDSARKVSSSVTIVARYLADAFQGIEGVRVFVEDRPMGDAGYIGILARRGEFSRYVVVIYGDVFTDADISTIVDFHKRHNGDATMMVVEVPPENALKYGVVVLGVEGIVRWFVEKPSTDVGSRLVNAGIYVFSLEALKRIPEPRRGEVKFSRDVIPRLVEEGRVRAVVHRGIWFDVGTPRDYLAANLAAAEKYCGGGCVYGDVRGEVLPPAYVGPDTVVERDSVIGPGAVLVGSSVVGPMSLIRNSVIMRGSTLEGANYVIDSILGDGVYLSKWVRVEEAVISDDVYVKEGVRVGRGASIGPHREVDRDVRDGEILP